MGGVDHLKESISLYLEALEQAPGSYEAHWKSARAHREYGEKAKREMWNNWRDICSLYGKAGMKYARKAADLEPDLIEGHYYYGLNAAIYSDGVSILTAVAEGLKNKTQQSFEKAYKLNRMYDEAGPILALGRFWAVIPWPFRDREKALNYYREYQRTGYFAQNPEAKLYLAELLMALKGPADLREANALLNEALQSDERYHRDWAKKLLDEMAKAGSGNGES
jgi:hypothetical protein